MEVLVVMAGWQPVEFNRRILKREIVAGMPRGLCYHVALCQRDRDGQVARIFDPSFRKPKLIEGEEAYFEHLFGQRKGLEELCLRRMVMPMADFQKAVNDGNFDPYKLQEKYQAGMVMI
jgi:hypothetical protein